MEAATATKAATATSGKRFRRQQRQDQCRGRYEYRNPAHGNASSRGQARTYRSASAGSPHSGETRISAVREA
jgi:hypothetical protein